MIHDGTATTMRPLEIDDVVALARWRNESSEWFFSSLPLAKSEQRGWYERYLADASERMFVMESHLTLHEGVDSVKVVGALGLVHIDRLHQRAELGRVVMDKDETGRGHATTAIRLLTKLAFDGLNLQRLYTEVLADNEAAIGLYQRCGFAKEGRLRRHVWKDGRFQDVLIMGHLRGEG